MTGHGRAEGRYRRRPLVVELRSVNHRYCDVQPRVPRQFDPNMTEWIRKKVQSSFSRGHIEVTVSFNGAGEAVKRLSLDRGLARQYYRIVQDLRRQFSLSGEISLSLFAGFRELITVSPEETLTDEAKPILGRLLDQAVARLIRMRRAEGKAICKDLVHRLGTIDQAVGRIQRRQPIVVEGYRKRLSQRVAEISGGIPLEPLRLSQEVALFADRADISEECLRLKTHLGQFHKMLQSDATVGRTLDFLLQEMNREINTLGAKANDAEIAHEVVHLKGELEKMREQVQNIE